MTGGGGFCRVGWGHVPRAMAPATTAAVAFTAAHGPCLELLRPSPRPHPQDGGRGRKATATVNVEVLAATGQPRPRQWRVTAEVSAEAGAVTGRDKLRSRSGCCSQVSQRVGYKQQNCNRESRRGPDLRSHCHRNLRRGNHLRRSQPWRPRLEAGGGDRGYSSGKRCPGHGKQQRPWQQIKGGNNGAIGEPLGRRWLSVNLRQQLCCCDCNCDGDSDGRRLSQFSGVTAEVVREAWMTEVAVTVLLSGGDGGSRQPRQS